ncbi:MAG: MFS transporter [Thermoprotei archaeon]|nr:MFS transporter [Thermoprotei archaeon]
MVALVRSSNAVFIVSLALTLPGISPVVHGLILASYALAEGFTGFVMGGLYERLGLRRSLVLATLLLALAYTTMNVFLDPVVLALLNCVGGVSAALTLTSSLSILAEETRGRYVGRIYGSGFFEASNLGGYALGLAVAASLELLGALRGFMVPAFLSLAALAASLMAPQGGGRNVIVFTVERGALKLLPLWFGMASLIGVGFMAPKVLVEAGIKVYLDDQGGGAVSPVIILGLTAVSIGLIVGSYIASRVGKVKALIIGSASLSAAIIVGGLFYETLLDPLYMPVLALLAAPAMTLPPALLALLADYTDRGRARGPQMGVYVTALALGIAFGEFALGGVVFKLYGIEVLALTSAALFALASAPTIVSVVRDWGLKA